MSSKLLSRAKHSKALRDSGLFGAFPSLTVSLLITVIQNVYILYCRESKTYVFILIQESGYEILSFIKREDTIESEEFVSIANMLLQEEIRMPDAKKAAKPKSPSKPKTIKAASTVKKGFAAKPAVKAKVVKTAPKAKVAVKTPEAKSPIEVKVKKARGPNKKAKGSLAAYEHLLKQESELEKARKAAKAELKSEHDGFLKQAEEIKVKYQKLFNENIGSAPKGKVTGAKKTKTGYTIDQVQAYIDQSAEGKEIKIPGKNVTGVKRIKEAFEKAKNKDAESVLELLK
jgi:hypothetical protein